MKSGVRMTRKQAVGMQELIQEYIKNMKLSAGLNTQRIFAAWDEVSCAGPYTTRRFFRDGNLYITLNSSLVRNRLYFQKEDLIQRMNKFLLEDDLFVKDDPRVSLVKTLILK